MVLGCFGVGITWPFGLGLAWLLPEVCGAVQVSAGTDQSASFPALVEAGDFLQRT